MYRAIKLMKNLKTPIFLYRYLKENLWETSCSIFNPYENFKVFPDAFENYWEYFTFDPPKYQLDSLSYQKQGSLFKIEALLLLQNVVTDTKIIKKTHIIRCTISGVARNYPRGVGVVY
ncbi:Sec23 trunk domain-containing protein [Aphis craccivora]|uniref:Sec23 trunk domain-containing protein n=1 Tax=Aphis craccivora TaxID=307492 RepID=A0A6G0YWL4_APHCR|nr:Sec23 trunk domain-containing protein [Aphis craccivora]